MISKRIKISVAFLSLTLFTSTALWQVRSPSAHAIAPSVTTATTQMESPLSSLNRKAKATKHADPEAVRELTDEAFNAFTPADLPIFTQETMRERVARAEVSYRKGAVKGISEVRVAKTINELAEKLALPDYAKVSVAMVRTARVALMLELPNLIAQNSPGYKKQEKKIGSSINRSMSPLEATTLTLFLLQQKTHNEDFQFSHEEFYANLQQKQVQRWKEERARREGTSQTIDSHAGPAMQVRANQKTDEIRRSIEKAVTSMRPDDLLNLADSSLENLGIKNSDRRMP
jgi:hypothetical protein